LNKSNTAWAWVSAERVGNSEGVWGFHFSHEGLQGPSKIINRPRRKFLVTEEERAHDRGGKRLPRNRKTNVWFFEKEEPFDWLSRLLRMGKSKTASLGGKNRMGLEMGENYQWHFTLWRRKKRGKLEVARRYSNDKKESPDAGSDSRWVG